MGWQSVVCSLSFHGWCPQPAPLFDYPFGHLYFFMLTFADIFVLLLMLSVVGGFFMRLRSPAWWLSRMWADPSSAGTPFAATQRDALGNTPLTVLLPCYLPNEQTLLDTTISHLLEKLEYSYPFQLIICYNTPHPLEYEAKLATRDGTTHASGRTIRVLKVEGSTSKAQNLNAALELVETEQLVIYDADHHPDPHSLLIASAHMQSKGCSCVQGSTYLRERPSLLSAYINAEFFVTHFVFFPAMEFISSLGVFGGSNALWKTEALKSYEFRHDVQTEDIELSTRAMLGGRVTISFCPECRSGELPPATFTARYKQRLRWALGWDQVRTATRAVGGEWRVNRHPFGGGRHLAHAPLVPRSPLLS
jgi:cellulose synthase/poly-beta-1,6-N-acetylglucosamine synthase-like glycosyltransferase